MIRTLRRWETIVSVWIVRILVVFGYFIWLAILNAIGPSTQYHSPELGISELSPDGKTSYVYLGDEFYVNINIVRHRLNGTCTFYVERFAEDADTGEKFMISVATLHFQGQNTSNDTRWPIPSEPYYLGTAVKIKESSKTYIDERGNEQKRIWFGYRDLEPDHDRPLLPEGVDERPFTFYVVGRYYCNILDDWIPRYIQGGDRPNITPRIDATLRRHDK